MWWWDVFDRFSQAILLTIKCSSRNWIFAEWTPAAKEERILQELGKIPGGFCWSASTLRGGDAAAVATAPKCIRWCVCCTDQTARCASKNRSCSEFCLLTHFQRVVYTLHSVLEFNSFAKNSTFLKKIVNLNFERNSKAHKWHITIFIIMFARNWDMHIWNVFTTFFPCLSLALCCLLTKHPFHLNLSFLSALPSKMRIPWMFFGVAGNLSDLDEVLYFIILHIFWWIFHVEKC